VKHQLGISGASRRHFQTFLYNLIVLETSIRQHPNMDMDAAEIMDLMVTWQLSHILSTLFHLCNRSVKSFPHLIVPIKLQSRKQNLIIAALINKIDQKNWSYNEPTNSSYNEHTNWSYNEHTNCYWNWSLINIFSYQFYQTATHWTWATNWSLINIFTLLQQESTEHVDYCSNNQSVRLYWSL
jgi:hypothetical protein